jgi:hypothetical protein
MPNNRFSGLLLIVFCVAAWIGIQMAGYVEFDTARQLVLTGTFRHIVGARMFVSEFEKKMSAATTTDEYWTTIRDASRELECKHVRLALRGAVFEDQDRRRDERPCCTLRIPLSDTEYVNFKYPAESSKRHAVAISSIVEILQRALAAREPALEQLAVLPTARRARVAKATRVLGTASTSSVGTRGA